MNQSKRRRYLLRDGSPECAGLSPRDRTSGALAVPVFDHAGLDFQELLGRASADPLAGRPGEPVSVRVVRIPPGPRTQHRHPESCEVVYVAAGTGRVWEGETSSDVASGDVVVIPTGVPHATVCTSPEPLELVCFFPHADLSRNLEELAGPERR